MSINFLRQVRGAIEQLNPNEVRESAERRFTVRLTAADSGGYAAIEDFLMPAGVSHRKRLQLANIVYRTGDPRVPEKADLEICHIRVPDSPEGSFLFDPRHPHQFISDVLEAKQADLGLALARCFPAFRKPATDRIITTVSRENAVFALMTAMPDLAPGLALPWSIPEALSDTAVLTVNQIRMAFLLAAASDRPVGYREQKAEVASIITGAFGWRALARELVGKIPFGGGLLPKAGIAFAGTYVAGLSLERLYRVGYGYTRGERSLAYGEALARGREVATAILEGWRRRRGERTYRKAVEFQKES